MEATQNDLPKRVGNATEGTEHSEKASSENHGLTAEQIAAYEARVQARKEANGKPLPGPLLEAFLADPIKAAGFELLPLTPGHFIVLQGIDSPVLKAIGLEKEEAAKLAFGYADVCELVFVSIRKPAELRGLLRKGREEFREEALATVADNLSLFELVEVEKKVVENFARSFSTGINYEARAPEDGSVFRQPPAEPMTGSVGGSNSSAGS